MLVIPVSERLLMPELRLSLLSASFHAKTLRFRTTSTCLCFWNSFEDSNLACFSMISLGRVISRAVARWFSSQLCYGPHNNTRSASGVCFEWVRRCCPELSGEEGDFKQRSCMRTMTHSKVQHKTGRISIVCCPTTRDMHLWSRKA